jgi:type III pantothenate kinase
MLLTVDVGNTNMVFGLFEGTELLGSFRIRTVSDVTSDEIGIMASEYFNRFGYDPTAVEAVIVASVVPQVMYSLTSAIIKYFGKTPLIVNDDVYSGLRFLPELEQYAATHMGADRSVTDMAAYRKYGGPLIVIDFGTATTMDAVDENGVYLGGTIGTGLRVTMDALIRGTAMLPRVEVVMPETVLGATTTMQIQAGVVGGYVGNVEYLIGRMKKEMGGGQIKVIATGGLARMVAENTDKIDIVDSQLTLDGLRMIYETMEK